LNGGRYAEHKRFREDGIVRSEFPTLPRHAWKTFLAFLGLGSLTWAILDPLLNLWFDPNVASMAAAGVSVPIVIGGNKAWANPRVLPWVILVLIATGIIGGVLGATIGG
jgi:hypothetical protein